MQILLKTKEIVSSNWTTGFNVYRIYCALKGHFNSTSVDMAKYKLKTRITSASYDKRSDKMFFDRIATKLNARECYLLCVYNFVGNPDCLSYELSGSDSYQYYLQHQGRLERMKSIYNNEIELLIQLLDSSNKKFKDLLRGEGHPVILQLLIQNKISIETVLLINSFIPIIELINSRYTDDLLWSSWYIKMIQYEKLLDINKSLAKTMFASKIKTMQCNVM